MPDIGAVEDAPGGKSVHQNTEAMDGPLFLTATALSGYLSMSCAAASLAMSRWSRCERGTPSMEILNRAAGAFSIGVFFADIAIPLKEKAPD